MQSSHKKQEDNRSFFTTRLCIRNLPKDAKEDDVRNWISKGSDIQITDCRILRKGKQSLAFVGVSSAEQADLVIKQRDRTYYRTSRIVVERAYKSLKQQQAGANVGSSEQAQQDAAETDSKNEKSKFSTLVAAATASASRKVKFWANDAACLDLAVADRGKTTNVASDSSTESRSSRNENSSDRSDDDDSHADSRENKPEQSDTDFLKSIKRNTEDLEQDSAAERGGSDEGDTSDDADVDRKDPSGVVDAGDSATAPDLAQTELTSRVFVRNLPFSTTEEDLQTLFESSGGCTVVDCHIPVTDQNRPKGFAFVTLEKAKDVSLVIAKLDACDFQGRILHLLPAHPKEDEVTSDTARSYKDRKEEERRKQADSKTAGLSSYVRADAVVNTLASRLGFQKGDILSLKDGLSSGDAAVRLALGETAVIEENRKFLEKRGIDLSAENTALKRSNTCILVKNLPADTTEEDLIKVFGAIAATTEGVASGPSRLDLAPSRTLAVLEYSHRNDAKTAIRRLAYRRFKNVPLYLEWAPMLTENPLESERASSEKKVPQDVEDISEDLETGPTPTVHVKNLNFATTEERLRDFFLQHVEDIRAVRIPQKVVPVKRVGNKEVEGVRSFSMGYGFVEFASQESCRKVIKCLQGTVLDGHALEIAPSTRNLNTSEVVVAATGNQKLPDKLVVRNVPFQATRKDLLSLFGSYGQLKKVRLPKKFDGTHRGFAFVEYLTGKEAAAAYKALSSTHLYGRHLVIEWATEDDEDLDKLREKTKRKLEGPGTSASMAKKAHVRKN